MAPGLAVRRRGRGAWALGAWVALAPTIGHATPGCDAIVYFDAKFGGESMEVYNDQPFVGPHWNDRISSIRVLAGNWVFFRDADYRGDLIRYAPGAYPVLPPQWTDQISSFRCVGGAGPAPGPGPVPGPDDAEEDTYAYQGQTYAWYEGGWNGPGFYVIGLQLVRGRGFGGREGDHGWHHRRGHDHGDHDRDHRDHGGDGHGNRGGDHPPRPLPPGPPSVHPPGPPPGVHPPGFRPPDPHPSAGPRPAFHPPGPHPAGPHPAAHPPGPRPGVHPHPPPPHRGGHPPPRPHGHR